jgi:hypothetical protein
MVIPPELTRAVPIEMVEISPPTFRASAGLHKSSAAVVLSAWPATANETSKAIMMTIQRIASGTAASGIALASRKSTGVNMRKVGLLILLLLPSCVTSSPGIRPLRPLELAVGPYPEAAPSALSGSLMYEGGCLLFRDERSRSTLLPVWPIGSVFNGTSVIFHQPAKSDQRIVVGEEFLMEGQRSDWSALPPATFLPFRHQCGAQPFLVSSVHPAD